MVLLNILELLELFQKIFIFWHKLVWILMLFFLQLFNPINQSFILRCSFFQIFLLKFGILFYFFIILRLSTSRYFCILAIITFSKFLFMASLTLFSFLNRLLIINILIFFISIETILIITKLIWTMQRLMSF